MADNTVASLGKFKHAQIAANVRTLRALMAAGRNWIENCVKIREQATALGIETTITSNASGDYIFDGEDAVTKQEFIDMLSFVDVNQKALLNSGAASPNPGLSRTVLNRHAG